MISSKHEVWKYANYVGELDDLIPYIEDLIDKWSSQNSSEVCFTSYNEITIAMYLLKDGLLPYSARIALSNVMIDTINEAIRNKLRIKSLFIEPPKPGRKDDDTTFFIRRTEVYELIKEGKSSTEAYKIVAEKHFKSTDTIRRDYERFLLRNPEYKRPGDSKK